jgi:hypothetical protein
MQNYTEISPDETLESSLALLLNNDKTALSCSSGTAFPTDNLQVGMFCYRTDLGVLYTLKAAPDTWVFVADINLPSTQAYTPIAHVSDPEAHQDIRAIAEAAMEGLRMRGIVLSALTPVATNVVVSLAITTAGSGSSVGDVFYISLPSRTVIPSWVVVSSVGASGNVTGLEIVNPGVFADITDTSDVSVEQGVGMQGTGLEIAVTFDEGLGPTIADIANPRPNDAVVVLHSDIAGGGDNPWLWIYADQNGDGVCNRIPGGGPLGAPIKPEGTTIEFDEEGKLRVVSTTHIVATEEEAIAYSVAHPTVIVFYPGE